jgi:hypothetical protein
MGESYVAVLIFALLPSRGCRFVTQAGCISRACTESHCRTAAGHQSTEECSLARFRMPDISMSMATPRRSGEADCPLYLREDCVILAPPHNVLPRNENCPLTSASSFRCFVQSLLTSSKYSISIILYPILSVSHADFKLLPVNL